MSIAQQDIRGCAVKPTVHYGERLVFFSVAGNSSIGGDHSSAAVEPTEKTILFMRASCCGPLYQQANQWSCNATSTDSVCWMYITIGPARTDKTIIRTAGRVMTGATSDCSARVHQHVKKWLHHAPWL